MMKRWIQFFKHKAYNFRWAILSGILVGTSYIPFPPWALIFCYAPLWLLAIEENANWKQVFFQGAVTQFVLTLIGFHWIAYTAHEFGNLPWVIAILALLLFCAFMHLYVAVAVGLGTLLKQRLKLSAGATLVSIALLHSLLERGWPAIFQWNLGYTLFWAKIPTYHFADVVGFEGLSTIILLLNAWVAYIWVKQNEVKKAFTHLGALVALFIALVGGGILWGKPWNEFDHQVKATVIQANIGNQDKVMAEKGQGFQEEIVRKFLTLSQQALQVHPETDILIWPETAFPDYLDSHLLGRKHTTLLTAGLSQLNKPLITGAYSRDVQNPDPKKKEQSIYNGLFLVDSSARAMDIPYRKTELLAFGEYLPLTERFPIILEWLPFISNFGRGPGPSAMTWNHQGQEVRWGGQICYEGLYPGFSRGLALKNADILVNVTNDSWFGKTFEPDQHLYMTLARGIETRRPLLRSTNTGISTAVLANGQVLQQSPLHQEWFGEFVIRYKKAAPQTYFVLFGHWDWIVILGVLLVIVMRGLYHARTRRS